MQVRGRKLSAEESSVNKSLSGYRKRTSRAPDLLKKWLRNGAEGNCCLVFVSLFSGNRTSYTKLHEKKCFSQSRMKAVSYQG